MLKKKNESSLQQFAGMSRIGYVNAIDGLRAIAIVSVIVYHARNALLPSGLVGVDVFFVISGFVVSASVLSHRFSSATDLISFFFARRILRIVPALIICLLVTAVAATAFIPQSYVSRTNLGTGLAAFFGLSNIVLYQSSDSYFAPRAELNPFTHTWSLAVEEQFYLIFPFLAAGAVFLFGRQWSRRAALVVWGSLTAASVIMAWRYSIGDPAAGFYLSPGRFWELGIGVLTYLLLPTILPTLARVSINGRSAMAFVALAGIAVSLGLPSDWAGSFPFPAVIPVVACTAFLIVVIVAHPSGPVSCALSLRPISYIGRISYSLYLWHWPIFVLMRWTVGLQSPIQVAVGVTATALFAIASYHLIETPLRHRVRSRSNRLGVIAAGLGALVISSGSIGLVHAKFPNLTASVTSNRYVWSPEGPTQGLVQKCGVNPTGKQDKGRVEVKLTAFGCTVARADQTLFVVGDSHAGAMIRVFEDVAIERGISTKLYSLPGCPVLNLIEPESMRSAQCQQYVVATLREIRLKAKPGDILFLPSLRIPRLMAMDGGPPPQTDSVSHQQSEENAASAETEAAAILHQFSSTGINVVFSAPLPVFRFAPFRCSDWFNRGNPVCQHGAKLPRREIDRMRSDIVLSMNELSSALPFVSIWDPVPALCGSDYCSAFKNGKPLFFDGDHLSGWGDDNLYPSFINFIDGLSKHPSTPSTVDRKLATVPKPA